MVIQKETEIGGRKLILETGRIATQAPGSVLVQYEGTVVLVTSVSSMEKTDNFEFSPLSVDYREKAYASGKIPGGFFKREGRPSEKEILSSRLVDRPIRPLFSKYFPYETQVVALVLSSDGETEADTLSIIGASAALSISDIPFNGPIGAVKIGKINGQFIVNPSFTQLVLSNMEIVVAGSENSIIMVEGEAKEVSEEEMIEALQFAHNEIKKVIPIQRELMGMYGKEKRPLGTNNINEDLYNKIKDLSFDKIKEILSNKDKTVRRKASLELFDNLILNFKENIENETVTETDLKYVLQELEREEMRRMITENSMRIDGRGLNDIREITCEIGILPRTHGSALFTRGQTQALCVTTLGTKVDEQKIEGLEGEFWKSYMLHYNFQPFSVGEVKPVRGPGRREIGHGFLAERALKPVIPKEDVFPYTIRIVSDILESNGSSSMASVCAGSLSLMDAGVPVKDAVAGIAMGLVMENSKISILTDILGDEDHLGDMDFKVAGTKQGITAFQMDVKIEGITFDILYEALKKAKEGRFFILDVMNKTISKPRERISPYAPKIITFKIDPLSIGLIIGSGGKVIREIQEKCGVAISIENDGTIFISASGEENGTRAKDMIKDILEVPEVGKIYNGKVKKIMPFGAFVEIMPGKEGLLHISEIETYRIKKVEDVLKVGDDVEVKVIKIDPQGKIDLSRKVLQNKKV
jgi:polyribonucleotide nucleotidyltransferase